MLNHALTQKCPLILGSKSRKAILALTLNPITPTEIRKATKLKFSNVSRELTELSNQGLITCLTPKSRVGRLYMVTSDGIKILEFVKNRKLLKF